MTCPIPQLHAILQNLAPEHWKDFPYASNWSLICTGKQAVVNDFIDYKSDSIELIRRGVDQPESNVLIVQMSNTWSKEHLELSREEVTDLILDEIKPIGSDWLEEADFHAHRWRFARPMHQPDRWHHQRITFAGDAWASPVGTIEASLKSAEFAALELIWKLHSVKEKKPISMQTTLF